LNDPARAIRRAMDCLEVLSATPVRRSSLWRTTPVDCPPGSPPFINAAVAWEPLPGETPESLLAKLQALERTFGRQPKQEMNAPRPLDLDLIAFGGETRSSARLALPHPRAPRRRFVLQPLAEIVPDFVLPGQTLSIAALLAALPGGGEVVRLSLPGTGAECESDNPIDPMAAPPAS